MPLLKERGQFLVIIISLDHFLRILLLLSSSLSFCVLFFTCLQPFITFFAFCTMMTLGYPHLHSL